MNLKRMILIAVKYLTITLLLLLTKCDRITG
jgi:hypothetical protein